MMKFGMKQGFIEQVKKLFKNFWLHHLAEAITEHRAHRRIRAILYEVFSFEHAINEYINII